jgi:hypothetical protein
VGEAHTPAALVGLSGVCARAATAPGSVARDQAPPPSGIKRPLIFRQRWFPQPPLVDGLEGAFGEADHVAVDRGADGLAGAVRGEHLPDRPGRQRKSHVLVALGVAAV